MAGPWEKYAAAPAPEQGPWTAYAAPAAERPAPKPFNVLPFSEDAQGKVSFDINAGLPGALIRAVKAPYDAMTGQFDPMSPEGRQRALETALTISPASTALKAGERVVPGILTAGKRDVKPPTAAALKDTSRAQYKAAKDTGAEYPGSSMGELSTNVERSLQEDGILGELAPQTFSILKKLSSPPEDSTISILSLDAARKALNRVAGNYANPTEQEAARRVIERLDDFIQRGGESAPMAGAAPAPGAGAAYLPGPRGATEATPEARAAELIKNARGNAAANFRSDRLTGVEDAAELRSSAANSGRNLGNTLRQRLASLLLDPRKSRGFSKDEVDAIRQVVEGTPASNVTRYAGNLLGGGGGIGQAGIGVLGATAGGAMGGPVGAGLGAALPLVGATSRAVSNALTARQVRLLDELIRKRSPLFDEMVRGTPLERVAPERRAALMRALLLTGDNAGQ